MIHLRAIFKILGALLLLETVLLLACALVSLYYENDVTDDFLYTSLLSMVLGSVSWFSARRYHGGITQHDGYLVVTIGWVLISLVGMLPFYTSGYVPDLLNCFFETISGFTTTGATVINNIDTLPQGLLFWRSLTHWIGGLGIIFFYVAILSIFGFGDMQLFAAESVGPPVRGKLHPRMGGASLRIIYLYIIITFVFAGLMFLGGMPLFDAVNHSMSTIATGGFSTHQASIAYYDSNYLHFLIIFYMFISGVNFPLLYRAAQGRIGELWHDDELRWYLKMTLLLGAIGSVTLYITHHGSAFASVRDAFFIITSCITTTGFNTADYMQMPPLVWGLMCLAMLVGACAGSTSGGIKQMRIFVVFKVFRNELIRIMHPNAMLPIVVNGKVVSERIQKSILGFVLLYITTVFIGILAYIATGLDLWEALSATVSCMGGVGPGIFFHGAGGSWDFLSDPAKIISCFLMLAGRLELFPLFLMFSPHFWRH